VSDKYNYWQSFYFLNNKYYVNIYYMVLDNGYKYIARLRYLYILLYFVVFWYVYLVIIIESLLY